MLLYVAAEWPVEWDAVVECAKPDVLAVRLKDVGFAVSFLGV